MPPEKDAAWSEENVRLLRAWIDAGLLP
jgi:hypothetical protein